MVFAMSMHIHIAELYNQHETMIWAIIGIILSIIGILATIILYWMGNKKSAKDAEKNKETLAENASDVNETVAERTNDLFELGVKLQKDTSESAKNTKKTKIIVAESANDIKEIRGNLDDLAQKVAADKGVPKEPIIAILKTMGVEIIENSDEATILAILEKKADEFIQLKERLEFLSDDDPVVNSLKKSASAAFAEGRFDEVENLLQKALDRDLAAAKALKESEHKKLRSAAKSAALMAETAALQPNRPSYRKAIQYYAQATDIVAAVDATAARQYQIQQADMLKQLGDEFGDNEALRKSFVLYQEFLAAIDRATHPDYRAAAQNNLGNVLKTLGERESNLVHLKEAATFLRAALEVFTHDRKLLQWATIQNNLADTLRILGERERSSKSLKEAEATCRDTLDALREYARESDPWLWADIQTNFGAILSILGDRENDTVRLEEAVTVFRAARKVFTRERAPLRWATIQNNLGNALVALGERKGRENGTKCFEEAVGAFLQALKERRRERIPLKWADTQNNLGAAFARLGECENDIAYLEEAEDAYRAALEEFSQECEPMGWAMAKTNLGAVLLSLELREQEKRSARLEEAIVLFYKALKVYTWDHTPWDWARTKINLGTALLILGKWEGGTARLEESVAASRAVLHVAYSPDHRQMAESNLEEALSLLEQRRSQR